MEYSFTGLESAVQRIVGADPDMGIEERRCLAREAMRVAFEHVAERVVMALQMLRTREEVDETVEKGEAEHGAQIEVLVVSGGVAANGFLRAVYVPLLLLTTHFSKTLPSEPLCSRNRFPAVPLLGQTSSLQLVCPFLSIPVLSC